MREKDFSMLGFGDKASCGGVVRFHLSDSSCFVSLLTVPVMQMKNKDVSEICLYIQFQLYFTFPCTKATGLRSQW